MRINKPTVWSISRQLLLHLRGDVHTQTATLNVKLTFVGVWVEMPEVTVVSEMIKTIIS